MEQDADNNSKGEEVRRSRGRTRGTFDRVLLLLILAMQIGILALLFVRRSSPTPPLTAAAVPHSEIDPALESILNSPRSVKPEVVEALRMQDRMQQAMAASMRQFAWLDDLMDIDRGWETARVSPAMDMRDDGHSYVVLFSLPGVPRSSVSVTLQDRLLRVVANTGSGAGLGQRSGVFERFVRLPGPVGDGGQATATLTNGVLRVTVPKGASVTPVGRGQQLM